MTATLHLTDRSGRDRAQRLVTEHHYLRKPVDVRSMPEAYEIAVAGYSVGVLIVGRPEATRCYPWYGSVEDVESGRAEVTRWQVLNLARVWLAPEVQGKAAEAARGFIPGFVDRRGIWRSTLASAALAELARCVRTDYLLRRPPCFLEEPYELRWLLSYCDTRIHRGTIYRAAGWELYRTNRQGIQTWRTPLGPLDPIEDAAIRDASRTHPRSIAHRARRAQTELAVTP